MLKLLKLKKMKKAIYLLIIMVAVVLAGCSKLEDFGTTNDNPNATTNPITAALLTNTLSNLGGTWAGQGLYCQFFSETQYPDFPCYALNQASPMGNYSGALYDLQNIIITNTDDATKAAAELYGANDNQIAIARILKAYIFWTITDRWGDVPYTDALLGESDVTFDTQETIYKGLIQELTEAVAQFTTGATIQGDIAYNGNIAKWKKLANSMRMLMALRLSNRYPGASDYAATEFKAALNDAAGSISDNADNFTLNYPGGSGWRNPFYNMYDGRKDYGESATMSSFLVDSIGGDGRQGVFSADVSGNPTTAGVPYGWTRDRITDWTNTNTNWAYIFAPAYRDQTSPLYIVKASSVLLARAEAADRGWTSENTQQLYEAGITASFEQWGLAAPDATYFTKSVVALGPAGTNLPQIAKQQWIAYFPDGMQGWSNWRRTGWPELSPAPDATNTPPVIPRRYMYGTDDYSLNKAAVEEAVARLAGGKDVMDAKVWWDAQ
jgi:hypothetical protein